MKITEAMVDPQLFGSAFSSESWDNWRELLSGFYGYNAKDAVDVFRELTKREPPASACDELWLVVGRRGGKSNIAALIALYEAIFNNHKDKLSPGEMATVMVIAADRKQARTVMRYVKGLLSESPILRRMVVREDSESIELSNRCVIEIMAAGFRRIRGYTVAAAVLDEIAFWHSEGANPDAEILAALRPSLVTLGGKLVALSSPYARRGVLWNNYKRYFGRPSKILVAQAPSMLMNPSLPLKVVEEARAEDPTAAAAEYDAQFRTDVEGYVSIEVLEACTRAGAKEILPSDKFSYTAFVDPSGGSADAMTLAVCHMDNDSVVVDAVRSVKPPFSPEFVVAEFSKLLKSYRITTVRGDAYAGEWPREQFRKRGIDYKKSERTKSEIYKDLLPILNSEKVLLPSDQQLQREFLSLERKTARGGRDSIDHAPGAHDDLANAVAGAVVFSSGRVPATHIKLSMAY